ncbi:hypothetical protein BS50DRAFT_584928 [Corynespora cassiicola Philippines]|uniref:Uncharacterized protein n=1 Tax=Corynespora cassiicola Philippines TaxID=1448308 RepID=A0A2T2P259_CORCC|nr:hypothetical protein BS50DRAFT_584928 [Corynespora cassiicola Philippines]
MPPPRALDNRTSSPISVRPPVLFTDLPNLARREVPPSVRPPIAFTDSPTLSRREQSVEIFTDTPAGIFASFFVCLVIFCVVSYCVYDSFKRTRAKRARNKRAQHNQRRWVQHIRTSFQDPPYRPKLPSITVSSLTSLQNAIKSMGKDGELQRPEPSLQARPSLRIPQPPKPRKAPEPVKQEETLDNHLSGFKFFSEKSEKPFPTVGDYIYKRGKFAPEPKPKPTPRSTKILAKVESFETVHEKQPDIPHSSYDALTHQVKEDRPSARSSPQHLGTISPKNWKEPFAVGAEDDGSLKFEDLDSPDPRPKPVLHFRDV